MKCSFQKLLVPVDLSEASLNSLAMAVILARKCDAHIYLLNVTKSSRFPNGTNRLRDFNRKDHDFVHSLISATSHLGDFSFDLIHAEGNVEETVIRTANSDDYDMLITGVCKHGNKHNNSTAGIGASVMGKIKCPVLLVPENIRPKPFRKILFPIDHAGGIEKRINALLPLLAPEPLLDLLDISSGVDIEEMDVVNQIISLPDKLEAGGTIRLTISPPDIGSVNEYLVDLKNRQHSELIVLGNEIVRGSGHRSSASAVQELIEFSEIAVLFINESPVHMLAAH